MAVTNTASLTFEYADATTRTITFTDVDSTALPNIKTRVLQTNALIADSVSGVAYTETFISDDGAPITRISKAKYTVTNEEVIYRG